MLSFLLISKGPNILNRWEEQGQQLSPKAGGHTVSINDALAIPVGLGANQRYLNPHQEQKWPCAASWKSYKICSSGREELLPKLGPLPGPCMLTFVVKMETSHETSSGELACFLLNNFAFDSPNP